MNRTKTMDLEQILNPLDLAQCSAGVDGDDFMDVFCIGMPFDPRDGLETSLVDYTVAVQPIVHVKVAYFSYKLGNDLYEKTPLGDATDVVVEGLLGRFFDWWVS